MASVNEIISFISLSNLHTGKESFSFINYLNVNFKKTDTFDLTMLESFFDASQNHQYWRENKIALAKSLFHILNNFSTSTKFVFSKSTLNSILSTQYVEVGSIDDLKAIILKNNNINYPQAKTFFIPKKESLLTLFWTNESSLMVQDHCFVVKIKNASLELLPPGTNLTYSDELKLVSGKQHSTAIDANTTIYFTQKNNNEWVLKASRGYTFNCEAPKVFARLNQTEQLYKTLKDLEANYINPASDPEYAEVCSLLEAATDKLNSGDYESIDLAQNALVKGKYFLNNVFPSDKMLTLLITNLEYTLTDHMEPRRPRETTNPWQKTL